MESGETIDPYRVRGEKTEDMKSPKWVNFEVLCCANYLLLGRYLIC